MKRRTFLCASAVSLAGAIKTSALPLSFLPVQQQWLSAYIDAVGATPLNQFLIADQDLNALLVKQTALLSQTGYQPLGSSLYYTLHDQVAMYPLALYGQGATIIDLVLVFFQRNATAAGGWQYSHTFSGFDLEAVCRAIDQVRPGVADAADLFVPVYVAPYQKRPFIVRTTKGHIELQAKVGAEQTRLALKVCKSGTTLLEKTYLSQHTLSDGLLA